jgi:DNA-binding GntR family transcriptional regulator
VVPVSIAEVDAVMETRMLVERFALDKVLAGGPATRIADTLDAAIAEQEVRAAEGDADGFVAVDREFHTTFVTAAGNPIITGLYDSLRDRQRRMIITSLLIDTKRITSILVEHRALADAIRDGDLDRAQTVLEAHLRGTLDLVRPG